MTTPRPWAINGQTSAGWRIDTMVPRASKKGLQFMMNPIAIVLDREDAELIVKLANQDAKDNMEEDDV